MAITPDDAFSLLHESYQEVSDFERQQLESGVAREQVQKAVDKKIKDVFLHVKEARGPETLFKNLEAAYTKYGDLSKEKKAELDTIKNKVNKVAADLKAKYDQRLEKHGGDAKAESWGRKDSELSEFINHLDELSRSSHTAKMRRDEPEIEEGGAKRPKTKQAEKEVVVHAGKRKTPGEEVPKLEPAEELRATYCNWEGAPKTNEAAKRILTEIAAGGRKRAFLLIPDKKVKEHFTLHFLKDGTPISRDIFIQADGKCLVDPGPNQKIFDNFEKFKEMDKELGAFGPRALKSMETEKSIMNEVGHEILKNGKTKDGKTALEVAFYERRPDLVARLVDVGSEVDMDIIDDCWSATLDFDDIGTREITKGELSPYIGPLVMEALKNGVELESTAGGLEGSNLFTIALSYCNEEVIEKCIEKAGKKKIAELCNQISRYEISSIEMVLQRGLFDVAKQLIESGADVNLKDENGRSLLYNIFEKIKRLSGEDDESLLDDYLTQVKFLIDNGANIYNLNYSGESLLHMAIETMPEKFVQRLLEEIKENVNVADLVNTKNKNGKTPLYTAIDSEKPKLIELLIESGAKIDMEIFSDCFKLISGDYTDEEYIKKIAPYAEALIIGALKNGFELDAKMDEGANLFTLALTYCDKKFISNCINEAVNKDLNIKLFNTDYEGEFPIEFVLSSRGFHDVAKQLIKNGADVNIKDENGSSLLSRIFKELETLSDEDDESLFRSYINQVEFLIDNGANVYDMNDEGESLLHIAVDKGLRKESIQELLDGIKEKVDVAKLVNTPNKEGKTPLYTAIESNKPELVKLLVGNGASLEVKNEPDDNVLVIALMNRNEEIINYLVELNPNLVNTPNKEGLTPLHIFSKRFDLESVKFLLGKAVNLEVKNDMVRTAFQLVIATEAEDEVDKKNELINFFVNEGASLADLDDKLKIKLFNFSINGSYSFKKNKELRSRLIELKPDIVNVHDDDGLTPLQHASLYYLTGVIEELIAKGADITITDRSGKTTLQLLLARKPSPYHTHIKNKGILFLIEKGFSLEGLDDRALSRLFLISILESQMEFEEITAGIRSRLIKLKPDIVNIQNDEGLPPLHVASHYGFIEVVEELLANGANLNGKDKDGSTALIDAIRNNEIECATLLIAKGADVNLADNFGKTALQYSSERPELSELFKLLIPKASVQQISNVLTSVIGNNNEELALQLIEQRPDVVNVQNDDGFTPLHCAAHAGFNEIIKLLSNNGANIDEQDRNNRFTPLMLAIQGGHMKSAEFFMNAGANINLTSMNGKTALHFATDLKNDSLIIELLKRGANPYTADSDRNSLIFDIVNEVPNEKVIHIFETIDEILKTRDKDRALGGLDYRKVPIDGSRDTLLHAACRQGNGKVVDFLLAKGMKDKDFLEKNMYYETALRLIFDQKELWFTDTQSMMDMVNKFILKVILENPNHQEAIVRKIQEKGIAGFLSYLKDHVGDILSDPRALEINPLEIPLLLNDYDLAQKMKEIMKPLPGDKFNKYLGEISEKYGAVSDEFCNHQNFFYKLDPSHLEKGLETLPEEMAKTADSTEENPKYVKLESLYEMLHEVYTSDPKSVIPDSFTRAEDRTEDALKKVLEGFIDKVNNKTQYIGIPDNDDDRIKTYKTIEIAQTHIIKKLQSLQGPDAIKRKAEVLRHLIEEVQLCGGKLISLSLDLYYEVCQEEIPSFELKTYKILANERTNDILANVPVDPQSVHAKNELMHDLGVEKGIPGGKDASEFNDRFRSVIKMEMDKARDAFDKRYNSYAIANIIRANLKDSDYKDLFLKWAEKNDIVVGFQAPKQFVDAITQIHTNPARELPEGLPKNFKADIIGICSTLGIEEGDMLEESDYSNILDAYFNATTWMETDFDLLIKEGSKAFKKLDKELQEIILKDCNTQVQRQKRIKGLDEMFKGKDKYLLAEVKKPLLAMYCEKHKIVSPSDSQMAEVLKKLNVFQ